MRLGPAGIIGAAAAGVLGLIALAGAMPLPQGQAAVFFVSWYGFDTQDRILLALLAGLLGLVAWTCRREPRAGGSLLGRLAGVPRSAGWIALAAGLVCIAGTHLIFAATPVSYDEVMAVFDAAIFRTGQFAYPVAPEFREFLPALVRTFWLDIPGRAAWVSTYWPGNAALQAIGGTLTGPLLAAVTIAATADIAARLWPGDRITQLAALLLLATGPQFLIMAMTPYAMSAHLALNMLWLALYLRDRAVSHAAAIAVAALTIGLHQPVFHPLFAGPFLLLALMQRRYRLFVVYALAYGMLMLAWLRYPGFLVATYGTAAGAGESSSAASYLARWTSALAGSLSGHAVLGELTVLNAARFIAWQSPLLLPLLICAGVRIRRLTPLMRTMLAGLLLTWIFMALVLPYQGRGWGYRYLHGQLGIAALLAAEGFRRLSSGDAAARWRHAFTSATGGGLLVMLPAAGLLAAQFAAPIIRGMTLIRSAPADVVVIDENGLPFATDLVRNRPDLSNRPLIMQLSGLTARTIQHLCASGQRVMIFDRQSGIGIGFFATEGAAQIADPPPTEDRALLNRLCQPERLLPQR